MRRIRAGMAEVIGSQNQRLRDARDLLTPKGRRTQARFSFEGPTLLGEALDAGIDIDELYVTSAALAQWPRVREVPEARVYIIDDHKLAQISDLETPTGIVAVTAIPDTDAAVLAMVDKPIIVLAGLSDPGNVGTLFRSAEAFGIGALFLLRGGVDPYHPKVVRGAMGSTFRLPSAIVDIAAIADLATRRPLIRAEREGEPIASVVLPSNVLLAIGHESHGFPPDFPVAKQRVCIPHIGRTESLNAAVAGSILMYEISRKDSPAVLGER